MQHSSENKSAVRVLAGMLCFLLLAPGSAALSAEAPSPLVLDSVVAVLPLWPGYEAGGRGTAPPGEEPEGSAVAVRAGGYLATALHVVDRATRILVRLSDGRVLPAELVGRDAMTDIALLRIEEDLPVLPMGPAPPLGERVCTLGNQFGLGLSLTCGVVSASHRTGTGFNRIEDFVQTDAAVNPGASGGALLDRRFRLVGLVLAIFTKRSDGDIGINFAASTALLRRVIDDLAARGRVVRGRPGMEVRRLGLDERSAGAGALVTSVAAGGAAAEAGIRTGDLVIAVGRRRIDEPSDFLSAVHMFRPGEAFEMMLRRAGEKVTVTMALKR